MHVCPLAPVWSPYRKIEGKPPKLPVSKFKIHQEYKSLSWDHRTRWDGWKNEKFFDQHQEPKPSFLVCQLPRTLQADSYTGFAKESSRKNSGETCKIICSQSLRNPPHCFFFAKLDFFCKTGILSIPSLTWFCFFIPFIGSQGSTVLHFFCSYFKIKFTLSDFDIFDW